MTKIVSLEGKHSVDTKDLRTRVPESVHHRLSYLAEAYQRTVSDLVREGIMSVLMRYEQMPQPIPSPLVEDKESSVIISLFPAPPIDPANSADALRWVLEEQKRFENLKKESNRNKRKNYDN